MKNATSPRSNVCSEVLRMKISAFCITLLVLRGRRAHDRADFPERDDATWLKHSLWFKEGDRLEYKPVTLKPLTAESIAPKARTY